jgi:hypothetical protein
MEYWSGGGGATGLGSAVEAALSGCARCEPDRCGPVPGYRTPRWASFVARLEVPLAKPFFSHKRATALFEAASEICNPFGFGQAKAGRSWLTCSSGRS